VKKAEFQEWESAMNTVFKSAGDSGAVISSTAPTSTSTTGADSGTVIPLRPVRDGAVTISELIDKYMLAYAGRDTTRAQRLRWWQVQLGSRRLVDLDDDDVHFALQELAARHGRYTCGRDADGAIIFKAKPKPLTTATVNRYGAALGALWPNPPVNRAYYSVGRLPATLSVRYREVAPAYDRYRRPCRIAATGRSATVASDHERLDRRKS
jgi:hypothetical protein